MNQTSTAPRRGRENRLARARSQAAKYPYIQRKLAVVELLSSEAAEIIEANAETILEEIGRMPAGGDRDDREEAIHR
jgi:trimethylamine:corrinoid methyltransferase-like protein